MLGWTLFGVPLRRVIRMVRWVIDSLYGNAKESICVQFNHSNFVIHGGDVVSVVDGGEYIDRDYE